MPPPCLLSSSNLFFFFASKVFIYPFLVQLILVLCFVFCFCFNERESKWLQSHPGAPDEFSFFISSQCLWLHWVLVVACGSSLSCTGFSVVAAQAQLPRSIQDLSSPTRYQILIPCIERLILNHWTTREVPHPLIFCPCLQPCEHKGKPEGRKEFSEQGRKCGTMKFEGENGEIQHRTQVQPLQMNLHSLRSLSSL